MALVVLWTERYRPDFKVTLRTSYDWERDLPGVYENGGWQFDVPWQEFQSGFEYKFVLNQTIWATGGNRVAPPAYGGTLEHWEGGQGITFEVDFFNNDSRTQPLLENPYFAQKFLAPNTEPNSHYNLIVIGSGFGGGIVAEQAADRGLNVLVLEAGSYIFPTHVANLPRKHALTGNFNKNIWALWYDYKTNQYENTPGSGYNGGFGLNLGGRSVFWGAYIPRMADFEFTEWPTEVRDYLFNGGYDFAESLVGRIESDDEFTQDLQNHIGNFLTDYRISPLPLSVLRGKNELEAVPSGVFSTADLLIESRLTNGAVGNQRLTLNLNHPVRQILTNGSRATGVICTDRIAGVERTFAADKIVLAAGSINSAAIALNSNLRDDSGLLGKGLTDHPIFFIHFTIPDTSPHHHSEQAAKLMLHHQAATAIEHRYVAFVDYGSDLGLSRFLDPDTYAAHNAQKKNRVLCEVVFQFSASLVNGNYVSLGNQKPFSPIVNMTDGDVSNYEYDEMNRVADQVRLSLGGDWINAWTNVTKANLGDVAHEAGTLRMGAGGVVDANLKFHNYDNLYACDLGVFPTSPAANPSLTLAALAQRLANHL